MAHMPTDHPKAQAAFRLEDRSLVVEDQLEGGWYVAATYVDTIAGLELLELKVFPGGQRELYYAHAGQKGQRPSDATYLRSPGVWEVSDVDCGPVVGSGGVTARMLGRIRIGALQQLLQDAIAEGSASDRVAISSRAANFVDVPVGRPGKVGRDDRSYLSVAVAYDELTTGGARAPIKALSERLELKREQVRDLIYQCRRRGLLTEQKGKGLAGGRLTEYALQLIDGGND